MKLIVAFLFLVCVLFVGIVPFRLLYMFSDLLAFIIGRGLKYRRNVVILNLKKCFPDFENSKINSLTAGFYKNLSDVFLEWVKSFSMGHKQIVKRHRVLNPEIALPYLQQGKSVIAVTGHYNNWEWGSISAGLQIKSNIVGFYKPLSNPWLNKLIIRSRSRSGTKLASIYETSQTFAHFANEPTVYLMAADQCPSNHYKAYWLRFFGHETAFLHGPEKYIRTYNYPVIFIDIQRIKRGYYTCQLSLLVDDPSLLKDGEITQIFATKLESVITKQPENWLWSHKRWKLKKTDLTP